MSDDTEMVLKWIVGRKRLLDLIEGKVRGDGKMDLIVERLRHWDSMLREEVVTESLRVEADAEEPPGKRGF